MVVVRSKVRDLASEHGIDNVTAEFPDKVEEKIRFIIAEACRRARENGRKTVMSKDL